MELVDFLLARISEDEEAARAGERADVEFPGTYVNTFGARDSDRDFATWADRFTPGRMLAECEARRRMIQDVHIPFVERGFDNGPALCCDGCSHDDVGIYMAWPCETVRLLLVPYVGHADWQEEWRSPLLDAALGR